MLGKVFKYEMKSLARWFLPLLAGFFAVTLLCKFSFEMTSFGGTPSRIAAVIAVLFAMLYGLFVAALFVLTAVFIVVHFYKTMTGGCGYLSHTLPVKTRTLIHAKLLTAIVWPLIACAVLALSVLILVLGHISPGEIFGILRSMMQDVSLMFRQMAAELHISLPLFVAEWWICLIASLISAPLMVYVSIAMGQLFLKHRLLCSVLVFFGIYAVLQIVTTAAILAIGGGSMLLAGGTDQGPQWQASVIQLFMLAMVFLSVGPAVVYYMATNYIFSKKLNLE